MLEMAYENKSQKSDKKLAKTEAKSRSNEGWLLKPDGIKRLVMANLKGLVGVVFLAVITD